MCIYTYIYIYTKTFFLFTKMRSVHYYKFGEYRKAENSPQTNQIHPHNILIYVVPFISLCTLT